VKSKNGLMKEVLIDYGLSKEMEGEPVFSKKTCRTMPIPMWANVFFVKIE